MVDERFGGYTSYKDTNGINNSMNGRKQEEIQERKRRTHWKTSEFSDVGSSSSWVKELQYFQYLRIIVIQSLLSYSSSGYVRKDLTIGHVVFPLDVPNRESVWLKSEAPSLTLTAGLMLRVEGSKTKLVHFSKHPRRNVEGDATGTLNCKDC